MVNVLVVVALLALAALFFFLAVRAWRARRAFIRFPGMILSGLLGLLLVAVAGIALLGFYRLNNSPYTYTERSIPVTGTADHLARGERLANICAGCHSTAKQLPLDGSAENLLSGPGAPPVGELWATDLTPSGPLKDWTDEEIARAIREGVNNQGRPLMIMPSVAFRHFSDEDVAAIVAYLRSQPPSGRSLPPRSMNVMAALFIGSGMFSTSAQPPITQPVAAPQPGTVEHGEYVSRIAGCRDCHGETLSGEPGLFGTSAPNLRAEIQNFSQDQFLQFFTIGKLPDGRLVSPEAMPWKDYRHAFTDEELVDLFSYLRGLPAEVKVQ